MHVQIYEPLQTVRITSSSLEVETSTDNAGLKVAKFHLSLAVERTHATPLVMDVDLKSP